MARSVQSVASWKLPTGQLMGTGSHVLAGAGTTQGYDTPQTWIQGILNAYELLKPPLVNDRWKDLGGAGSGSYATMAEYILPADYLGGGFTGVGTTIEGLVVDLRARIANADSATLEVVTPDDSDSVVYAGAAESWVTVTSKVDLIDFATDSPGYRTAGSHSQCDNRVLIRGQATTGSNVHLYAAHIRYWRGSTTLPGETYDSGFVPPDLAEAASSGQPLTVHQMRRLLDCLDQLKRRRCAGMIMASYLPGAIGGKKDGEPTNCAFRTTAWQPEHVTVCRVWLLGAGNGSVTVFLGEQSQVVTFAGTSWQMRDFAVPAHTLESPQPSELRVIIGGSGTVTLRACCAWWKPITGIM